MLWLALLDYQGSNTCAWPGLAVLSTRLHWGERTVTRWIRWLEEQGIIHVSRHPKRTSRYAVALPLRILDDLGNLKDVAAFWNPDGRVDKSGDPGVTKVSDRVDKSGAPELSKVADITVSVNSPKERNQLTDGPAACCPGGSGGALNNNGGSEELTEISEAVLRHLCGNQDAKRLIGASVLLEVQARIGGMDTNGSGAAMIAAAATAASRVQRADVVGRFDAWKKQLPAAEMAGVAP